MRYRIEVTQNDIDKGDRISASDCAVARACRRVFRKRFRSIGVSNLNLTDCNVKVPIKAQNFIIAFDRGKPVKPFSFEASAP